MNNSKDLAGQVICLAGASRGIGNSLAAALSNRGASVCVLSRSGDFTTTPEQENVLSLTCDVSDYTAVTRAASEIQSKLGRVDVVINTAAVLGATGPLWTTDPEEWKRAIEVNLVGTYHTMRAFLPAMIAARRGRIINFAGGGAAYAYPDFSGYGASKAAVVRLSETVAVEAEPFGVQVNVIAPGAIDTELLRAVQAAGGEVRTLGNISLVIDLVIFLVSPASDHIRGKFVHARDTYRDWLHLSPDAYTLRRVEPKT